jgi:hypothetical protein
MLFLSTKLLSSVNRLAVSESTAKCHMKDGDLVKCHRSEVKLVSVQPPTDNIPQMRLSWCSSVIWAAALTGGRNFQNACRKSRANRAICENILKQLEYTRLQVMRSYLCVFYGWKGSNNKYCFFSLIFKAQIPVRAFGFLSRSTDVLLKNVTLESYHSLTVTCISLSLGASSWGVQIVTCFFSTQKRQHQLKVDVNGRVRIVCTSLTCLLQLLKWLTPLGSRQTKWWKLEVVWTWNNYFLWCIGTRMWTSVKVVAICNCRDHHFLSIKLKRVCDVFVLHNDTRSVQHPHHGPGTRGLSQIG